jgi:HEAT repeat protein
VAAEGCNTLAYYFSRKTARCLHGLLGHPSEMVREEAALSYEAVREEFLSGVRHREAYVARHVREWLRPVWDLLAYTDEELEPEPRGRRRTRRQEAATKVPLPGLLALLRDPDVATRRLVDCLRENNWAAYRKKERRALRPLLLDHPDALVRNAAVRCLAAWGDAEGLVRLMGDRDYGVRKSAVYHLGEQPADPRLAGLAWQHFQGGDVHGVHRTETLRTFVRHADPAVAIPRLETLAADRRQRESVRDAAVSHLAQLGAAREVARLVSLLREPPPVTWALHLALLDGVRRLRLPVPDLDHLRDADNLHLQEALAECGANGERGRA